MVNKIFAAGAASAIFAISVIGYMAMNTVEEYATESTKTQQETLDQWVEKL